MIALNILLVVLGVVALTGLSRGGAGVGRSQLTEAAIILVLVVGVAFVANWAVLLDRRLQTERDLQRITVQLDGLLDIERAATGHRDVRELLHTILKRTMEMVDGADGSIMLVDSSGEHLTMEAHFGREVHDRLMRIALGEGIAGWVAQTGQAVNLAEPHKDSRFIDDGIPMKGMASVPMVVRDRIVGVINVQSKKASRFTDTNMALLTGVASFAALVLESAELFTEVKRKADEMSAMLDLVGAISSNLQIDQVLNEAIERAVRLLQGGEAGVIMLVGVDGRLSVHASYGYPPDIVKVGQCAGSGFSGRVAREGRGLVIDDVREDNYAEFMVQAERLRLFSVLDVRSAVCVPIRSGERTVGVMSVDNLTRTGAFSRRDLQTLEGLSQHISIALGNAMAYESLKKHAEELSVLQRVGITISKERNIQDLADRVISLIDETFGYHNSCFLLLDNEMHELRVVAARGYPDTIKNVRIPLDSGITGHAATTMKPCIVGDVTLDPRYIQGTPGTLSEAAIPITADNRVWGVLDVSSTAPDAFREHDVTVLTTIANQVAVALTNAHLIQQLRKSFLATGEALAAAVDTKDHYTLGHSRRVTDFAVTIARAMRLPERAIDEIRTASLLHDVGKIGIPEAILQKPGRLDPDEMRLIKMHPELGVHILQSVDDFSGIIPLVKHHHERYDGKGYPTGLAGEEIPLGARILSVADALDAMTSDRPYRSGLPTSEAVDELRRCAGTQFDPDVVDAAVDMLASRQLAEKPAWHA
jgi:GAF domain-containing protein